jgi:hypothetical protein
MRLEKLARNCEAAIADRALPDLVVALSLTDNRAAGVTKNPRKFRIEI